MDVVAWVNEYGEIIANFSYKKLNTEGEEDGNQE